MYTTLSVSSRSASHRFLLKSRLCCCFQCMMYQNANVLCSTNQKFAANLYSYEAQASSIRNNLSQSAATESVLISDLQGSLEKPILISIINTTGVVWIERKVLQNETNIDVSALPSGVYFCRIQSEGQKLKTFKLVVSH